MSVEIVKTYVTPHKPKGFGVGPFGPVGSILLAALAWLPARETLERRRPHTG